MEILDPAARQPHDGVLAGTVGHEDARQAQAQRRRIDGRARRNPGARSARRDRPVQWSIRNCVSGWNIAVASALLSRKGAGRARKQRK